MSLNQDAIANESLNSQDESWSRSIISLKTNFFREWPWTGLNFELKWKVLFAAGRNNQGGFLVTVGARSPFPVDDQSLPATVPDGDEACGCRADFDVPEIDLCFRQQDTRWRIGVEIVIPARDLSTQLASGDDDERGEG